MLPIFRILPVGGVLLAILIVVLALEPPGAQRPVLTPTRGALVDASQHPEWRQFLIQAALRRADELNRLLDLPDTPTRTRDAGKVAGLPASRSNSDPDNDSTGTISDTPSVTMPVDIGETSLFELPVVVPDEKPPAIKAPQRKTSRESRKKATPHRSVRATASTLHAVARDPLADLFSTTSVPQRAQPAARSASAPASVPSATMTVTGADPH